VTQQKTSIFRLSYLHGWAQITPSKATATDPIDSSDKDAFSTSFHGFGW
jgi:hypothetical protein